MEVRNIVSPLMFLLCLNLGSLSWATPANKSLDQENLDHLRHLLETPEDKVDFAIAKLTLDHIIDPSINITYQNQVLNNMASEARKLTGKSFPTNMEKKEALRRYLYEAGNWNQFKPFMYDFNDPKGTIISNKLLPNYIDTKKGNCISMPFLFITLGQKLGLDVTASTAPLHVFVKFTNNLSDVTYNLETTSGGNISRDSWLRQNFNISDAAIRSGIYLQKLSRRETVAVMADSLLQYYAEHQKYEQVIATADLLLRYYPKSINSIIYKASAYNQLMKKYDVYRYRSSNEVPPEKRQLFIYLVSNVNQNHHQAVMLGWQPLSQVEENNYLQKIKEAK